MTSIQELRELEANDTYFGYATAMGKLAAFPLLLDIAEAAQAVRKRHPANAESADIVLDRALDALEQHGKESA